MRPGVVERISKHSGHCPLCGGVSDLQGDSTNLAASVAKSRAPTWKLQQSFGRTLRFHAQSVCATDIIFPLEVVSKNPGCCNDDPGPHFGSATWRLCAQAPFTPRAGWGNQKLWEEGV